VTRVHFGRGNLGNISVAQFPRKQHLSPAARPQATFLGDAIIDHAHSSEWELHCSVAWWLA